MVTKVSEGHCTHSWVLASPNGSTSPGECAKCGECRRFANSFPDLERTNNSDIFAGRGRRGYEPVPESSESDIEQALSSMRGHRGRHR